MLTNDDLDTILTALHERRNRLIQVDMDKKVNESSVLKLRERISACNRAIRAVNGALKNL